MNSAQSLLFFGLLATSFLFSSFSLQPEPLCLCKFLAALGLSLLLLEALFFDLES